MLLLPTLMFDVSSEGYVRTVCSLVMPIADGILHMALELLTVTNLRLAKGRLFISKITTLKKTFEHLSSCRQAAWICWGAEFCALPK